MYSLGVVLYELLTGHSPYELKNRTPIEIARIITETQPILPSTSERAILISKTCEGTVDRLRKRLRGDLDNIVLMALRKEPQRRYQSAEQLSADISRHLEGLPVWQGKKRFIPSVQNSFRRNKVAVTIACVCISSSLRWPLVSQRYVQWRANQQAKFLQEFGQEVARIEGTMRIAYLLPLHDIQPEKKQIVESLNRLKKDMNKLGAVAYGPGHYSLGRGYLALHQYQTAYESLDKSME